MKSITLKFAALVLLAGLLSACGSQPAEAPTSAPQPTLEAAPATEAPTTLPADSAPSAESPATEPAGATTGVSFATDILPILESRCINCHGGEKVQEGLNLKTHADVMAGSENGAVVTPGDAANSLLAELVINQKMPKRGPKLTPPQVQLIVDWINQGAVNN